MNGLWSAQQREWLQAMGHPVWQIASTDAAADAPVRTADALREAAGLQGDAPRASRPVRGASGDDRLARALVRAAGAGADEAAVLALASDLATLRGNAAAKRALWPRLRALRRNAGAA